MARSTRKGDGEHLAAWNHEVIRMARMIDLGEPCLEGGPVHGGRVVGAKLEPGAHARLLVIGCVAGELDAEMPSAGKLTTSIGWPIPGNSTVRTGLPKILSKHSASSARRCGRAKICTLLPRAITT